MEAFVIAGFIAGIFLALLLPYVLMRAHYKALEERMVNNTKKLLERIDELEGRGKEDE